MPTGTLTWCTTTPEGIGAPEGIVMWCDESLNIECQVDILDVKLSIRIVGIHAVDRDQVQRSSFNKSIKSIQSAQP